MIKIILLFGMILIIVGCGNNTTGNFAAETCGIEEDCGSVSIPLSDITTSLNKYEYEENGVVIKYLAVLGSDGEPRIAFDGCDICGGQKGYEQKGSDVACINCGKAFKIDDIGSKNEPGGCWPSYLPFTIEGDDVVIQTKDLIEGSFRFES